MDSYTHSSDKAMLSLADSIRREVKDGKGLSLELNAHDSVMLVYALRAAHLEPAVVDSLSEWSGDFLSGIASTYGIEFV